MPPAGAQAGRGRANGHTYIGVGHAGEQIAAAAAPELFHRALTDIADFARRMS
jgi:acetyl esterase